MKFAKRTLEYITATNCDRLAVRRDSFHILYVVFCSLSFKVREERTEGEARTKTKMKRESLSSRKKAKVNVYILHMIYVVCDQLNAKNLHYFH